jgi:Putative phage tail protein
MATIILTAVGGLIGGPIGSALGAIIGQQVDNRLFAPKGRKGPRLNEFAVQTSSYGQTIPKLFGANRIAGSVIWSTDLKETKRKVSNGKGQPKSTVYSYSVSFAVALSGRPIQSVGRIWADGNLLRGAAGDFKTETRFRLYRGSENQAVDPLIGSAQGPGTTPAYRGMAYAMFEDFDLGDFGNRIPSLSFEVFADSGDVAIGAIFEALAPVGIVADCPDTIGGLAVAGDTLRGLAEPLRTLFPIYTHDTGNVLALLSAPLQGMIYDADDLGASHDGQGVARVGKVRTAHANLPNALSVAHYEPDRDYQQGLQRVRRAGGGEREDRIDLPLTMSAAPLKALAGAALSRGQEGQRRANIRLPWKALDIRPASLVTLPDDETVWRVSSVALNRMVVEAELVAHSGEAPVMPRADPGTGMLQPDRPHGPTTLLVCDLPVLDDENAVSPRIAVAAAGAGQGWKRASLLTSIDDGISWQEAGSTAPAAVMGQTINRLEAGTSLIEDRVSTLDVVLLHGAMALRDAAQPAILAGDNAALIGHEIVQFARAEPIGTTSYRLSGLLRGRRGTEWAISEHRPGDAFLLLDADALAMLTVPTGTARLRVLASGVGDDAPASATLEVSGEAVRPLPPAHLRASAGEDGAIRIHWVRRSRVGWRWIDGVDAPLGEERERYLVTTAPDVGPAVAAETAMPEHSLSGAMRETMVAAGASRITVLVQQIGSHAVSRPSHLILPL